MDGMLKYFLVGLIVIWMLLFWAAHGPAVFVYVGFHLVTTGVFALAMWLTDRKQKIEVENERVA